MIENLTDSEILQGLKRYDEDVTREFFYDTCHMAYCIDDRKYVLHSKIGMDFYSLAHEYYLRLCNHGWLQLEKRRPDISLSNWTMNGFHYLVRERLKSHRKMLEESIEERASKGHVLFDKPVDDMREQVEEIVEGICQAYYSKDKKAQDILRMILIMGMKGKEVASRIGISPAAVSQRYHTMMDRVVRPYFIKYYTQPAISYTEKTNMGIECEISLNRSENQYEKLGSIRLDRLIDLLLGYNNTKDSSPAERPPMVNKHRRITPSIIQELRDNEVFVFDSDLGGVHLGETVCQTLRRIGISPGEGVGPRGRYYAIPTFVGDPDNIRPYVNDFCKYVVDHPEQTFLVTPIGCGIAGFTPQEIAPMFSPVARANNISLPMDFWDVLG